MATYIYVIKQKVSVILFTQMSTNFDEVIMKTKTIIELDVSLILKILFNKLLIGILIFLDDGEIDNLSSIMQEVIRDIRDINVIANVKTKNRNLSSIVQEVIKSIDMIENEIAENFNSLDIYIETNNECGTVKEGKDIDEIENETNIFYIETTNDEYWKDYNGRCEDLCSIFFRFFLALFKFIFFAVIIYYPYYLFINVPQIIKRNIILIIIFLIELLILLSCLDLSQEMISIFFHV